VVLEPDVQDDEQVATAHFLELELRRAVAPVGPANGHDRVRIPADDGHSTASRRSEPVRQQPLDLFDDVPTIGLERTGRVVVSASEHQPDAGVNDTIEQKLRERVTACPSTGSESRPERAVIALPRFLPYSFTGRLPPSPALTRQYLRNPLAWRMLGKQFWS
jgi:hypothetical protein